MNQKNLPTKKRYYYALLANLIIPLAGMSTDVYLPSLPAMSDHFDVAKTLVQLTVFSYAIAMGFGQLFAGPISDALGRKKQLLVSLLIQIICVTFIIYAPSASWVIAFRFIQGIGAAFMIVPGRAILNDIFSGHELRKQFNYLTISFAIGPIIAPFIGGYIQHYIDWQGNFYFILIYALVLFFLLIFTFEETMASKKTFSVSHLWKNYHTILSNKHFVTSSILIGFLIGYVALFNVAAPFLLQVGLHYSAIAYGRVALVMGLAWFLGNSTNRILFHVNKEIKVRFALWLILLISFVALILAYAGFFNLYTLSIPTFFLIYFGGLVFPIYVGEGLSAFPKLAASSNAALFSINWLIFSLCSLIASFLKAGTLLPLAWVFMAVSIISLLIYYLWVIKLEKTP